MKRNNFNGFFKAIVMVVTMLMAMPVSAVAAITPTDGYYIKGSAMDNGSEVLHYKLKKVTGSTNQYYIDILGTSYTMAGMHVFNNSELDDNDNKYINIVGSTFYVIRVSNSGSTKTYYNPTSGYAFTTSDPSYDKDQTNVTESSSEPTNNLWSLKDDNGGMYHFVITVDDNGKVTSWQYNSNPKKVVAYKLGATSNWAISDFLYCSRTDVNASGNYKGYNQNFDGPAYCTKDEEFAFLMGDRWFKSYNNESEYTKRTSVWMTDGSKTSSNINGVGQNNLKFEYTDGAYAMQFKPTQDEYHLWGVNGGGTTTPSHIYIIGNAVGTKGATTNTFTDWNPDNATELTYDAEEGCWKGTMTFTTGSDKDFRFLYNKDELTDGTKNGLNLNLGEDANTPGNGGDTWTNNKVAYNGKSTDGKNVTFYGHGEVEGSYTVRFYMEAQEGKRFQDEDARYYWYTLEANNIPVVTLDPGTTSFDAGVTSQALTATETIATQYAWSAYTGNNTVDVDPATNLTTYTAGNGNFGTLEYKDGNIYLKNSDNTETLLASNSNTVTIAISPVVDGALSGATNKYTYTFTVSGGSTNVGTISPDGGFYVNKVQVTITPESGKIIYYALGGKQASASTSEAITSATTVWVSTPGEISISDGTNTQVSKAFDFTYSTSDNYLNYYHNGSSTQVVNTGGGKDAITVFFQTYNNDTHVYAWDYAKDAWYKGKQGSQKAIDGKYVALTSFIPGAALMDVNKTTFNGMPFYYFTTLKSSLTTYTETTYGDLSNPGVSFLANRGLNVGGNTNIVEAYKTADEAGIFFNKFYTYSSNSANSGYSVGNGGTYNNFLYNMNVHYNGKMTDQKQVKLTEGNANIVYFYKPTNWGTVKCYGYGGSLEESWPGYEMTLVDGYTNLYYRTFNAAPEHIIFTDGTNRTTADSKTGYRFVSGSYYVSNMGEDSYPSSNKIHDKMTALVESNTSGNIVFFLKPTSWSSVSCYAYNATANNGNYPGVSMTSKIENTDIYYCTLDSKYTAMIFNNGTNSTASADRSIDNNATGHVILNGGLYVCGRGAGSGPCDLMLRKESADRYEKFINTSAISTITSAYYPNGEDYYRNATGDQTLVLDPTWASSKAVSTTSDADWSGRTTSYADENNRNVNDLPRKVTGNTAISQDVVSLDANSNYTVQAIVKGANVTLTLKSSEDGTNFTTTEVKGTKPASGSLVTKSGRIEKLEPTSTDRQEGWYKVEATAKPATNGLLNISLQGDGEFYLADVTLLKDANTAEAGNMWTTAPLTNENTYVSYAARESHNAFSFFDRGENPNGLVAVDDHAVIANAGTYLPETVDYKSKVTGSPYNIVAMGGSTDKLCNHLYLTEQAQDGTMYDASNSENGFFKSGWTFFTPITFKATDITFDRVLPNYASTIVMPFAITKDEMSSKFGADYAFKFSKVKDNTVYLTKLTDGIPANTPAIVQGPANNNSKLTFTGVNKDIAITDSKTPSTTGDDGSSFIGQYEYHGGIQPKEGGTDENPEFKNYNFRYKDGTFLIFAKDGVIKPFRAYLHYKYTTVSSTGTPLKAKSMMPIAFDEDDNSTTAINDINVVVENEPDGPVYSISGMQVAPQLNGANLSKGIYIHNGKKIVVR